MEKYEMFFIKYIIHIKIHVKISKSNCLLNTYF